MMLSKGQKSRSSDKLKGRTAKRDKRTEGSTKGRKKVTPIAQARRLLKQRTRRSVSDRLSSG